MKKEKILLKLSELIVEAYDMVVLAPLDDERRFLLDAGKKSEEEFFDACHQVFGMNTDRAYETVIANVFDYCEFLHDTFDTYENQNDLWTLIQSADKMTSAAEYLSEHAPIESVSDKALWWGKAGFTRLSCNGLKSKFHARNRQNKT